MSPGLSASLLALLIVVATDAWVYADAKSRADGRNPVVASLGSLEISAPAAWFLGCLVLWIVFFPLYLVARRRSD
jgi:hypothetical protein